MNIGTAFIISLIGSVVYIIIGMFFSLHIYNCEHRRYDEADLHWVGFSWCFWPIVLIVYGVSYPLGIILCNQLGTVGKLTETIANDLDKD